MKRIHRDPTWPASWTSSFEYDLQEIYGQVTDLGYFYAYDNRRREALALISEVLAPPARILDIGGAQGNFSLQLAEMGYDVTWNDLRAELADYVRLKHEHGNLRFAVGSAFELRFPQPFDAVLITEIIEHVAHPDDFLLKVSGLVRPGGYIVMTTPNGGYFRNPLPRFSDCPDPSVYEAIQFKPDADGHIFLLHTDEITRLARDAGLRLDRLEIFTNSLTNGHIKLGRVLKVLPRPAVEWCEAVTRRLPRWLATRLLTHMAVRLRRPTADLAHEITLAA